MGWLSIFKPRTGASVASGNGSSTPDSATQVRTRARQRLVGAIVLVVIGVIGFPLVFETRPRPIPVDVAIEIPRKETAPPLKVPAAPPALASAPREEIVTESAADAGRDLKPAANAASSPAAPSARPVGLPPAPPVAAPAPAAAPAAKPEATVDKPATPTSDGERAQALLEGAATPAKPGARFVVQVGAFAETAAASEARGKVEKLGLKTYTQVADTPAGKRIRVRLGPFASRDEADKALAKARAAGLAGNVLAL